MQIPPEILDPVEPNSPNASPIAPEEPLPDRAIMFINDGMRTLWRCHGCDLYFLPRASHLFKPCGSHPATRTRETGA